MKKFKSALLIIFGIVFGVAFVYSCGSGGGGSSAEAVTTDQLQTQINQINARINSPTTGLSIEGILVTERHVNSTTGIAAASCQADEVIVGGGGSCSGYVVDSQAGLLFMTTSDVAYGEFVVACYDYSPPQASTLAYARVLCAKGQMTSSITSLKPSEDSPLRFKNIAQQMRNTHINQNGM